jgi:hypothetical protein
MGGIFQSDIFIKAAVELGIDDLRKNPYLIEHMLTGLTTNRYVREKYGQKQVDACKEWILNNNIEVNLKPRDDRDNPPCVTIYLEQSNEKMEMKSMGDQTPYSVELLPNKIGKPIPFIINPFIPEGYEQSTGILTAPDTVDLTIVNPGMILVNPVNGNGYVIQDVVEDGVQIEAGQALDASELAIVPQYQYYKARVEHTWNQEVYTIGCHAADPQSVIFLWSIVKYSLLRYRQSLLEGNGMYESIMSSGGGPDYNSEWTTEGGERFYTRIIQISCQTEDTWLKGAHRVIEATTFSEKEVCNGVIGGIRIVSNLNTPAFFDEATEPWTTVEDDPKED